mgnify:CR=1 FL=1
MFYFKIPLLGNNNRIWQLGRDFTLAYVIVFLPVELSKTELLQKQDLMTN